MTPLIFLLFAIAGGVGASVRYLVDGILRSHEKSRFDWATTLINVSGSLALGIIVGLTTSHLLPGHLGIIAATGFLGGYTTFSTASYETVSLIRERRYGASILSGLGMLVGSVAAAGLGIWIGSSI